MSKVVGTGVGIAGAVGAATGLGAWWMVRSQLAGEKITVPASATHLAGRRVTGPLTAYAQAEFIQRSTREATGGRGYGEIPAGDPAGPLAKEAALLRASLFTSILAFGVALAGMAVGAVLVAVGRALVNGTG